VGRIYYAISVMIGVISLAYGYLGIGSIAINLIILSYLHEPRTRAYFGSYHPDLKSA